MDFELSCEPTEVDKLLACCRSIEDSAYTLLDRHRRTVNGRLTKAARVRGAIRELVKQYPELETNKYYKCKIPNTICASMRFNETFSALELLQVLKQIDRSAFLFPWGKQAILIRAIADRCKEAGLLMEKPEC